jgi:hypothetical protein
MSSGAWSNNDGLLLQYGTAKATRVDSGDYKMPGPNRMIEVLIDLSKLITANATIVDLNTFFPSMANTYIEAVELVAEVGMSTSSSPTLSIGVCGTNLGYSGGTTVTYGAIAGYSNTGTAQVPTNGGTAFVSGIIASDLSTAGDRVYITLNSSAPIGADSYAGNYLGDYEDTTNLTYPMYITATLGTHTATGMIRCRIFYHGVGTISN